MKNSEGKASPTQHQGHSSGDMRRHKCSTSFSSRCWRRCAEYLLPLLVYQQMSHWAECHQANHSAKIGAHAMHWHITPYHRQDATSFKKQIVGSCEHSAISFDRLCKQRHKTQSESE